MIGLGPPGRIRPWRLSSTVTALRAAFPGAKVHIRHCDPRAGFADFAVSEPVTITEESRELLSMTTSWGPRRLRVAAEILNACEHEEAIAALIAGVAPRCSEAPEWTWERSGRRRRKRSRDYRQFQEVQIWTSWLSLSPTPPLFSAALGWVGACLPKNSGSGSAGP